MANFLPPPAFPALKVTGMYYDRDAEGQKQFVERDRPNLVGEHQGTLCFTGFHGDVYIAPFTPDRQKELLNLGYTYSEGLGVPFCRGIPEDMERVAPTGYNRLRDFMNEERNCLGRGPWLLKDVPSKCEPKG